MEKTTMSKNKLAMTLYDKIELIDSAVKQMAAWSIEATDLQRKADEERKAAKKAKQRIWIVVAAFIVSLFLSLLGIVGLIALIVTLIHYGKTENRPRTHIKKAEELEQKAEVLLHGVSALKERYAKELSIVPEQYWYPAAMRFIREAIESGRASIVPEATALYEEYLASGKTENPAQTTALTAVQPAEPEEEYEQILLPKEEDGNEDEAEDEPVYQAAPKQKSSFWPVLGATFSVIGKIVAGIAIAVGAIIVFALSLVFSDDN